jgi:hypothetical protein
MQPHDYRRNLVHVTKVASWNDLLVERRGISSDMRITRAAAAAAVRRIGRLRVKFNTRDG